MHWVFTCSCRLRCGCRDIIQIELLEVDEYSGATSLSTSESTPEIEALGGAPMPLNFFGTIPPAILPATPNNPSMLYILHDLPTTSPDNDVTLPPQHFTAERLRCTAEQRPHSSPHSPAHDYNGHATVVTYARHNGVGRMNTISPHCVHIPPSSHSRLFFRPPSKSLAAKHL